MSVRKSLKFATVCLVGMGFDSEDIKECNHLFCSLAK